MVLKRAKTQLAGHQATSKFIPLLTNISECVLVSGSILGTRDSVTNETKQQPYKWPLKKGPTIKSVENITYYSLFMEIPKAHYLVS